MKKITAINFEIPGEGEFNNFFHSKLSLDESDIIIIKPFGYHSGVESSYLGKDSYGDTGSKTIKEDTEYWHREVFSFIELGKNVFIITSGVYDFYVQTGRYEYSGTGRNARRTNYVDDYNNYKFIEKAKIKLTNANGSSFKIVDSSLSEFSKTFGSILSFKCYLQATNLKPLLTTKNGREIVSGALSIGKGNLVMLPYLEFDELTESKNGKEIWTKEAIQLGKNFTSFIIDLNDKLLDNQDKSIKPIWLQDRKYQLKVEPEIEKQIDKNNDKINKLTDENSALKQKIEDETLIKNLVYETGKPLEKAVIKALEILGYEAENYADGKLELDAVIVSPEGVRFIGECEGKDKKDIDISKFRQLTDSLAEDFEREDVKEKAKGIIFGNPQRLLDIDERTLDFTEKCRNGAMREGVALIKTYDLFFIAKYLLENKDEKLKKLCRDSITNQMGRIVQFPDLPKARITTDKSMVVNKEEIEQFQQL